MAARGPPSVSRSHGPLISDCTCSKPSARIGTRLIARKVGESLVLERRETVEKRLLARFRHIPGEVSLVDELIAERRGEAAREAEET